MSQPEPPRDEPCDGKCKPNSCTDEGCINYMEHPPRCMCGRRHSASAYSRSKTQRS